MNRYNLNYLEVPREENDTRFIKSFTNDDVIEKSREFFDFFESFGFVVIRNVLEQEEIDASLNEMFEFLERTVPGFDRSNVDSWKLWNSESFGMCGKMPVFTQQMLLNRQNINIYRAFASLIGTENLRVNHDRWAIYRPTELLGKQFESAENIHLDINPWRFLNDDSKVWDVVDNLNYGDLRDFVTENTHVTQTTRGRQLQGILNLVENEENDGGLMIIPGFHRDFENWVHSLGPMTDSECRYKFPSNHPFRQFAIRVPCRAGSLVIWDQRCVHGSRGNRSERMRGVQFMRMQSAEKMPNKRARNRQKAIRREMEKIKFLPILTDVGRTVFGIQ